MATRGAAYRIFAGRGRPQPLSRHYSHFVRLMKTALPAAALALLAVVFAWPEEEPLRPPGPNDAAFQAVLANMQAHGWDRERPYRLRAPRIRQLGEDGSRFAVERPEAAILLEDGARLAGSGASGVVDWERRTVRLAGGVRLEHDRGYVIRTESAFMDLDGRTVRGDKPVEGAGESARFRSEGFRILEGGRLIRLVGRSALDIGVGQPPDEAR